MALIGACAAAVGRFVLAKLSRVIIRQRLLREQTRDNIDTIKIALELHRTLTFGAFLIYGKKLRGAVAQKKRCPVSRGRVAPRTGQLSCGTFGCRLPACAGIYVLRQARCSLGPASVLKPGGAASGSGGLFSMEPPF